jgi:hypothetical protein
VEPGGMTTTARRDLRFYGFALLTAFRAADTGRIAEVFARRPPHFNRPMPVGYMDILVETATHTSGTRERVFSPSFVFVFDPDLETDLIDQVVDEFGDYLTDNPHIVPNTVWDQWSVSEEGEEVSTAPDSNRIFPAVRFTLGNVSVREGRA